MNPEHLIQEKRAASNAFDQSEETKGGLTPPAFQLFASSAATPPAQRKVENEGEHGNDHDHDAHEYMEVNPGGEFPWDAMVTGGDAKLQKKDSSDATEVLANIPNGTLVSVRAEKGSYYAVTHGTLKGYVLKTGLQQLSFRLSKNEQLMNVMRGTTTLKLGDSGSGVSVMQQALAEISSVIMTYMIGSNITGTIDAKTEGILKGFQRTVGITQSGAIDQASVSKLNDFLLQKGYSLEGLQLKGLSGLPNATEGVEYNRANTPPELLRGTRNISVAEQTAFENAISTEAKAPGGVLPTFTETVGGKKYGDRIKTFLDSYIPLMYDRMAKGKQAKRSDATNLHDWGQIEEVAKRSKTATDDQFGKYRTGPALTSIGINAKIKDAWEDKEKELAADPSVADGWVSWRVQKLLDGHPDIKAIDQEHGAVQSRATERGIITPIKTDMMTKYRMELIEIHKAWPAFADKGNVFIQRFKEKDGAGKDDKVKGRDYMWEQFQTIIHEYIHTLEHSEHRTYRGGLDSKKGGFTLREGTTDYFTKVTYNNTNKADQTLREKVEGPFHEAAVVHPLPNLGTYGESQNAEAAAGIIGFPNMCAAFFLGRTELYKHT